MRRWTTILGRVLAMALIAHVFGLSAMAQTLAQTYRDPRAEAMVSSAGYPPADQKALVRALYDADPGVASAAAVLLRSFPATPESVAALTAMGGEPDEVRALSALTTLQFLGAKGWETQAVARLVNMQPGLEQIILAGILARAGSSEGWDVVRQALEAAGPNAVQSGGSLIPIAASNAVYFDGLRDLDGKAIEVEAELVRARPIAVDKVPSAVQEIDRLIAELRSGHRTALPLSPRPARRPTK